MVSWSLSLEFPTEFHKILLIVTKVNEGGLHIGMDSQTEWLSHSFLRKVG
jgi:hypothetical protein